MTGNGSGHTGRGRPPGPNGWGGDSPPGRGGPPGDVQNGQLYGDPMGGRAGGPRLRERLDMLWKGRWLILATTLAVLFSAAAYTFSQTPVYRASREVTFSRDQTVVPGVSTTGRQVLSELSSTLTGQTALQQEVYTINRSRDVRRRVAERLDSIEVNPHTGEPPRILFRGDGSRRTVSEVTDALRGALQAQPAQGEGIKALSLSVSSTSPGEAALLVNQFAKSYKAWSRRRNRKATRSSRQFLESQAETLKAEVRQAEQTLESFMREEKGVRLDQRASRAVQKVAELQSRRDELQIELDMKKARLETQEEELARIRPKLAERLSSGIGSELAQVQREKADVTAEINRVKTRNPGLKAGAGTERARNLRKLQRRADRLDRQADSLASRYVEEALAAEGVRSFGSEDRGRRGRGISYVAQKQERVAQLRIEVSGLEAQLQTLDDQIANYQQQLDTLPAKQFRLAQLQRDRRAAENIYGFVREKLQEMRIAEASEGSYVELLEPARPPAAPVSPDRQRTLLLGLLLGLVGGIGLVIAREKLDVFVRTPDDLEALERRVLGSVPSMRSLLEEDFDETEAVEVDGQSLSPTAVILTAPGSAVAEAYRQLQVNLRYARPDAPIRSLLVTSPEKKEGKTTTALNLALAAARAGRSVTLVDADLRHPRLHTLLGVPQAPGLTEALYDEPAFAPTSIDNLRVLPAGEEVPTPSELLGSRRMRDLVERLEASADLVVIDTPPLLPFSDPTAAVPHTSGALLVAAAGQTDRRAYERARSKIEGIGPGIIGAVLNCFDPEEDGGYGSYYGPYDYGHYDYGDEQGERPARPWKLVTSWASETLGR